MLCKKVAETVKPAANHKSTAWSFEKVVFQIPFLSKAVFRHRHFQRSFAFT